jgi:hypothetical protein
MFRAYRSVLRRIHTAVHTTIGSMAVPFGPRARGPKGTATVRTNDCVNSSVNSPEDGPVGPKHVEIR